MAMMMKIVLVNLLLFNGGLSAPTAGVLPFDGEANMNISQSPVTVPASLASISANKNKFGDGDGTTTTVYDATTMYEIVEQELGSEPEMTTTLSNPTETTMPFINPSPNQEEVLSELQDLWYYSEALSDSQQQLKSSISSIVHLAYARVHTEPEETLDRLKYMLQKLRARLLGDETQQTTIFPTVKDVVDEGTTDDSTTLPIEEIPTTVTPHLMSDDTKSKKRHKRRVGKDGIGEIENFIFAGENSAENFILPILKSTTSNKNVMNGDKGEKTATPPSSATIQKIIHVEDRVPLPYKNPLPIKPQQIKIHASDLYTTSNPPNRTSPVLDPIMESLLNVAPVTGTGNFQYDGENGHSVTADQIANAIFLLFNPPMKNASSSPSSQIKKPIYLHDVDNSNTIAAVNDDPHIGNITANQIVVGTVTTMLPLPPYLFNLHEDSITPMMEEKPKPIEKKTSVVATTIPEMIHQDNITFEETSVTTIPTPDSSNSSTTKRPILQVMAEISESSLLVSPTIFLNGTIAGWNQFMDTFSTLSFAARITLLFVISVSVLSIALGLYSLGPAVIAIGILGILIPITLLVFLQNHGGRTSNKEKLDGLNLNAAIPEFPTEEFNQIIDLIFDAIKKFES